MNAPSMSVLVPTYGRVRLLEEVLQSFLMQDYAGHAELVILNDVAQQELVCDQVWASRSVRIINLPAKMNLGVKRNALIAEASHEMVQFWDDDDIYLPHRLSLGSLLMVQQVADRSVLRQATREEREWWWQPEGTLIYHGARPFGTVTTTKSAIRLAGSFPETAQLQDVRLVAEMGRRGMLTNVPVLKACPSVVYRRRAGSGVAHVTDSKQLDGTRMSDAGVESMMQDNLAARLASGQEPSGRIELTPHWDHDYSALAAVAWSAIP
jgi:hypothetical protein